MTSVAEPRRRSSRGTAAQARPSVPTARANPAQMPLANILGDLEAGEELIPLRRLSEQAFVPRNSKGQRPHPLKWYRWAASGLRGARLEVMNAPGLCSTRGAVLRFYQQLSSGPSAPAMTTATVRRQRQRTDTDLDAAGIR